MSSPPKHSECLVASAPGSLMLMGEHAVLHGAHALCAAVDRRISVELEPMEERDYAIESDLGSVCGHLDRIGSAPKLRFVLEAVKRQRPARGFSLRIRAGFDSTLGFGSSAAVTVAATAALRAHAVRPFDRAAVFEESLAAVRAAQGRASGADVAAAVYGGVVLYRADPLSIEPFVCSPPLAACYAGYKTPTAEVIDVVERLRSRHGTLYRDLFRCMDDAVREAAAALRSADWDRLGELFNLHHGLQAALGTSDAVLEALVHGFRKRPGVTGAKISGSGLGDCVIALGNPGAAPKGCAPLPLKVDSGGLKLEHV